MAPSPDLPQFMRVRTAGIGGPRHSWEPSPRLRRLGYRCITLDPLLPVAVKQARRLNKAIRDNAPAPAAHAGFSQVADAFLALPEVAALSASTQAQYGRWIRQLVRHFGARPVAAISAPQVQKFYRDLYFRSPAYAANLVAMLRRVLNYARRAGHIEDNPAAQAGIVTPPARRQLWPHELVAAFVDIADTRGRPSIGTAVMLAHWIGQRQEDLIAFPWTRYRDGRLHLVDQKTGTPISVGVVPALARRLDALPRRAITIVADDRTDRPYTGSGFRLEYSNVARAVRAVQPSIDGLQYRDLRRTCCVRLAEQGATDIEIAAITGHSIERTRAILDTYIVRTQPMADNAIAKLTAWEKAQ